MNELRSINNEMPGMGSTVLAYDIKTNLYTVAYHDGDGSWFDSEEDEWIGDVTHWAWLPRMNE